MNEMSPKEAAKYYASIGIIIHPLHGPAAKVGSPGKQPKKNGLQRQEYPYNNQEIDLKLSEEIKPGLSRSRNCSKNSEKQR